MPWKYINILVKLSLWGMFAFIAIVEIPALEGKGMLLRAPIFLAPSILVPMYYRFKKGGSTIYPHAGDALLSLPFVLDTFGNIFGLFDSVRIYDDLMHFFNWVFFITAYFEFWALHYELPRTRFQMISIGAGTGAILIILWELVEWVISVDGLGTVGRLSLTYEDTLGDLLTSGLGGLTGGFVSVLRHAQKFSLGVAEKHNSDPHKLKHKNIHFAIHTLNLQDSLRFYETIGYEQLDYDKSDIKGRERFVLQYRESILEIFHRFDDRIKPDQDSSPESRQGVYHIAIPVDDVDMTFSKLLKEFPEIRVIRKVTKRPSGSKMCFISDPDGVVVELIG